MASLDFPFNLTNISLVIAIGVLSIVMMKKGLSYCRWRSGMPPGPSLLHLIGLLPYAIRSSPYHHPLTHLANKYGPLMHLQLGQRSIIVVSSAKYAKQVMNTHDLACSDRPRTVGTQILWYNCTNVTFCPYGDYWKQMRNIGIAKMLSAKKVRSLDRMRRDEALVVIESIKSSCGGVDHEVNLSDKISMFISSMACKSACGSKVSIDIHAAYVLIKKASRLLAYFDVAELFPSIKLLRFMNWNKLKLLYLQRKVDNILGLIIEEHREKGTGGGGDEDLIDVLLRLKESGELGFSVTDDCIKSIILDMSLAGTETSAATVEWAMAELMKKPRVMAKAQDEVRQALKGKEMKTEEIGGLKYLKLVIKETLRLHPPLPIIPRSCREGFEIDGYHIPPNTGIYVNIWCIGRDGSYWGANAQSFEPERFENVNTNANFLGTHFEYIPFGSGRRMCPGLLYAMANVEFLLAQLLYHFDWQLPEGMSPDDLDMREADGIITPKKTSLCLLPTWVG